MKRNFIMIIMVFMLTNSAFCAINYTKYNDCKFETINNEENVNYTDISNVVYEYVPSSCQDAFLFYTKCDTEENTRELMIQLLAVGMWESGWKVTVSNGRNNNGTIDLGYLALNSSNAESNYFMSMFGPREDDGFEYDMNNRDQYYLITCIKFYKYLYYRYGEDAAYCYNGGETRYVNKNIVSSTYTYKKRVSEYIEYFIQEANRKADERTEFENLMFEFNFNNVVTIRNIYEQNTMNKKIDNSRIRKERSMSTMIIVLDVENHMIFNNKNKQLIETALGIAGIQNKEYVCIGYIKKYGSRLAPVFKSTITGEKVVC